MKNISLQYQDLQEGKMNRHQFLRNARMMFPNHVTQFNSFEDSITILKSKGLLNEGNAVKGTPDKAPEYDYPNEETKYKKVVQEPEVQEQDGIYPATTLTDIPKEKMDKKVKDKSDGLEPIKANDTKNEMKKIRIVKENKSNQMTLNGKVVDETSLEIDGVDSRDYPDFVDAYFSYGVFEDGTELTDNELDQLANKYPEVANEMAFESMIDEGQDKFDPKQQQKDDLKKFSQKIINQVQGGPPTKMNTLKAKIKDIVREVLDEMYDTDVAEFDVDTERFDDDRKPKMSELMDAIVDKFIDYKQSNDINLADDSTESELQDVIDSHLDKIGYGINDDYYNILFYGVKDELRRQGINFV
jgi:hypothetical protein